MRTDLNPLATYGYRDILDKAGLDFFSGEFQDQATLSSTAGEGMTGIDKFGDNAGQTLPTTEASLAYGRSLLSGMGLSGSVDQGTLEAGSALAGKAVIGAGDGGSAYAALVESSLAAAGYDTRGVTGSEISSVLGLDPGVVQQAMQGVGDPALIDAVIAAHSQLLQERGDVVGRAVQGGAL